MSDEEAAQIAAGGPGRDRDPGVLTARTAMGADWFVAVAPMLREVRAMGLTWRDLVSSAALVAMIVAYWALKFRYGPPVISTAWATSAVELVLGSICAVTAAIDLHTRPQPRAGRIVRRITTAFGSIALIASMKTRRPSITDSQFGAHE